MRSKIPGAFGYLVPIAFLVLTTLSCGDPAKQEGGGEIVRLLTALNSRDLAALDSLTELSRISEQWYTFSMEEIFKEIDFTVDSLALAGSPDSTKARNIYDIMEGLAEMLEQKHTDNIRGWIRDWWRYDESLIELGDYDLSWLFESINSRDSVLTNFIITQDAPNVSIATLAISNRDHSGSIELVLRMHRIVDDPGGPFWRVIQVDNLEELARSVRPGRSIHYGKFRWGR